MIFTEDDLDFLSITDIQFEELCFELLIDMGYQGLIWRQGGADNGRDIEGYYQFPNPLVGTVKEKWFFECKKYSAGLSPDQIYSKIAWADAEKPLHFVLFISSYLSNNARTWLEKIASDKPYSIHLIEGKQLKELLLKYPNIITKYFLDQYVKLLIETRKNWVVLGLEPDITTVAVLSERLDFPKLSDSEFGFFWCSAKVKLSEIDEWPSGKEPICLDYLFYPLTLLSNTISSIFYDELDISTQQIIAGKYDWEISYPNFVTAALTLYTSTKPCSAIYSLVYNSEGEGLEVLVEATSDFTTKIRHIKINAGLEAKKVFEDLLSKR